MPREGGKGAPTPGLQAHVWLAALMSGRCRLSPKDSGFVYFYLFIFLRTVVLTRSLCDMAGLLQIVCRAERANVIWLLLPCLAKDVFKRNQRVTPSLGSTDERLGARRSPLGRWRPCQTPLSALQALGQAFMLRYHYCLVSCCPWTGLGS